MKSSRQKTNAVCFFCRVSRRDGYRCPKCQELMWRIGVRERVPEAGDNKGWERLERVFCGPRKSWQESRAEGIGLKSKRTGITKVSRNKDLRNSRRRRAIAILRARLLRRQYEKQAGSN